MTKFKRYALLAAVAVVVTACGDGRRQYHGGHPIPGTFEVFSFEDPLGEIRGIALYMVLPVAIAATVSFLVSYFWTKRSDSKVRPLALLSRSVMCGIILSSFGYMFTLAVYQNRYDQFSISRFFSFLFFDAFFLGPALLIVGSVLLIEIFVRRHGGLPDWFLYTTSLAGLVAEYFWPGAIGQS